MKPALNLVKHFLASPVAIAIAARVWSGAAGLVSLYLLARTFTDVVQGFYYTFLSLMSLQAFAELGLLIVVVVASSHESGHLEIGPNGEVTGDAVARSRLIALGRAVIKWFGGVSLIFALVVGYVGFIFLNRKSADFEWQLPWAVTIAATALNLWGASLVSLREGCNQIASVNRFRFGQSAFSAVLLWIAIVSGAGIWAVAISSLASLSCLVAYTAIHRRFFLMFRRPQPSTFVWRKDILPMQWPLALQGIGSYFMFSLFVPVIFQYRGAEEAGRLGMSLQVITAIQGIAATWLTVALPSLGAAASRGDIRVLDERWARAGAQSMLTALFAGLGFFATILLMPPRFQALTEKVLPTTSFAIFLVWMLNNQLIQWLATYWRALKSEPIGSWGLVPGLIGGLAVWWGGKSHGSIGTAWAALASGVCVTLPLTLIMWRRSKVQTRRYINERNTVQ